MHVVQNNSISNTSLTWPEPFAQGAIDKCPREKGLVQVQYQTRSLTPSPSQGVNKYSSLYVASL